MVNMSQKPLFGTTAADWQERINMDRMRSERAERARRLMNQQGLAAILAAGSWNCRYLTGVSGPEWTPQLYYTLFFADGASVVFAHAGFINQWPDQAPWIGDWRIARAWLGGACGPDAMQEETKLFAADIYQVLRDRGLVKEKIGITGFDSPARNALAGAGLNLVDATDLMLEARAVKTVDEINCFKIVAAICEAAWYKVWESLKPGIRDVELSRVAMAALQEAGAESMPIVTTFSGPLTFDRGIASTGRIIQTGDLVYLPICSVTYQGYRSCTYRTLITGRKSNDKEKDWYKRLLERIDSVIDAIKPGATTADAAKHFPPASTWGYHDEVELLTMEIGHGIGLGKFEKPIINRQWSLKYPQVFEEGMIMGIESREGEPRVGGVRLENMVLVTKDGAEILDHMPRDTIWEPCHSWG
ncbi:M24 family metallopeptidase [Chloroflexota bacterium]